VDEPADPRESLSELVESLRQMTARLRADLDRHRLALEPDDSEWAAFLRDHPELFEG
jgi:hypothetical protein